MHLKFSRGMIVVNAKVNFNFRPQDKLTFTQNADALGAHVRQETGHKLAARTKQNAPIRGAPGAASPFGRSNLRQSSDRNSLGRWGGFWPKDVSGD